MNRDLNFSNKKGNMVLETITLILVLIIFGFGLMSIYPLFGDLNLDIQADTSMSNLSKTELQSSYDNFPSTFDYGFVIALTLIWGCLLYASFTVNSHPAFFIFAVILTGIFIIASALLSNSYVELLADSDFSSFESAFPITNYFIGHLVEFVIAIAFSVAVVLYAKLS